MSSRPDAATLDAWWRRWRAVKLAAYRELVARYPEGRQRTHPTLCAWPDEPPA